MPCLTFISQACSLLSVGQQFVPVRRGQNGNDEYGKPCGKCSQRRPCHPRNGLNCNNVSDFLHAEAASSFEVPRTLVCDLVFCRGRDNLCVAQGARIFYVSGTEVWK